MYILKRVQLGSLPIRFIALYLKNIYLNWDIGLSRGGYVVSVLEVFWDPTE